jgi:hypothetical protein
MRRIDFIYLAILLLLLFGIFAFNAFIAGGTISSPQQLGIDLGSEQNPPQYWGIQYWPAAINRVLFRWIVQGTWSIFFAPSDAWNFYLVFIAWSFVFFSGTVIALYFYLQLLEFDRKVSLSGCLLFLLSAPVLLAYKYPVYTREDPLAYFLTTLGLIAIFKSRPFWVAVIATAAALTRETTLIVPLAYSLASGESLRNRVLVLIPPILALVGIRFFTGVPVPTNQLEASALNLLYPWETLAFIFCTFGVLWTLYLADLASRWQANNPASYPWKILISTAPIILVLVLGTSLGLGRAREIRPTFLLFPWVIPFALDWIMRNGDYLRHWVEHRFYWVLSLSIFGLFSAIVLYFHLTQPELMRYYLADFKNGYWLFLGTLHLSATLAIFIPRLRRRILIPGT